MMLAIGMSAQNVLAAFCVKVGQKLGEQMIKKIPMAVLTAINKKAGFYLVAKYGRQARRNHARQGSADPGRHLRRRRGRERDRHHRSGHGQGPA